MTRRRRGIKRGNDERRSRTGDGSHCQSFPSSTSCTALQIYTNLTGHNHPKNSLSMSNPPPSLIPLRISNPSIPNSAPILCFHLYLPSCLSHTVLSLSFPRPPTHTHTHAHMEIFLPLSLLLLQPQPRPPSWVLEDLAKPRGRKSTFLPHQLAKPNVEKAQLKAIPLLMLTAIGNTPFA